jgi:hypothetical protein
MKQAVTHLKWRFLLNTCLVATVGFLVFSCDELEVPTPGEFQYPLTLTVESRQSVAELAWSEVTVSTLEEYIILRSSDNIPDSPVPEITGNAVIIARIDERDISHFKDSNLPIVDTVYYKVYARIEGRFLMSATISHAQNLHLLPVRADIVEHVAAKNTFVAFDRGTQQLLVYDYKTREFLKSRLMQQLNFPMIRVDLSSDEVFVNENGTSQFLDYNTLNLKQSLQNTFSRNAKFLNGWIYLTRAQFPYGFALYRRSDLAIKDELNTLQSDWRGCSVLPDPTDVNKATIYDFSLTGAARYTQNNTDLELDLVSSEVMPGGGILVAKHPIRTEFVVTSNGIIMDENLEIINTLENGAIGFNLYTYSPDGSKLFGMTFQNSPTIRVYDADNDYVFREEFVMSNQISPVSLFADEQNVYMVSLVFLGGGTQTLITTIEY